MTELSAVLADVNAVDAALDVVEANVLIVELADTKAEDAVDATLLNASVVNSATVLATVEAVLAILEAVVDTVDSNAVIVVLAIDEFAIAVATQELVAAVTALDIVELIVAGKAVVVVVNAFSVVATSCRKP